MAISGGKEPDLIYTSRVIAEEGWTAIGDKKTGWIKDMYPATLYLRVLTIVLRLQIKHWPSVLKLK